MPSYKRGKFNPEVGITFYEFINQKERFCTIIKVTPGRFQIEYDLNKVTYKSWRHKSQDGSYLPYEG